MVKQSWKATIRYYMKRFRKGSPNRMRNVMKSAWNSVRKGYSQKPQKRRQSRRKHGGLYQNLKKKYSNSSAGGKHQNLHSYDGSESDYE